MAIIKILVIPSKNELVIPVEDRFFESIMKIISKIKDNKNNIPKFEFPEIGLCGLLLMQQNSIYIYSNGSNIIYTNNNISEMLTDERKKINNLLLKRVQKKYYKELSYYSEVLKIYKKRNYDKCSLRYCTGYNL